MKASMKTLSLTLVMALASSAALAKLPAPSDEAKAKAAEAKARADWNGKVAAFKLCKAQDRVVAYYKKAPTVSAGNCADPGPFVYTPNVASAPAAPAPAAPAAVAAAKKP